MNINLNNFVFHNTQIQTTVETLVSNPSAFPGARTGIIFHGGYGTGKTTLARLLPDAIDTARGSLFSVGLDLELRCSSASWRDDLKAVHDLLKKPVLGRSDNRHYVLFDEFDLYGRHQVDFKSIMTHERIGFFITTNNLNAITQSVQSRCYHLELEQAPKQIWRSFAAKMFASQGIAVTPQEIESAIEQSRTLSTRDMTVTLNALLFTKARNAA